MKISTKGRYGLRAMIDLAVHSGGEQVALNSIADRQNISVNYLEQVFSALRKADLVKSVKGAQGGYILSRSPEQITAGDILRVLEGSLLVIDEQEETSMGYDSKLRECIRVNVWDKMNEAINNLVDTITLEDLADNYRKMNGMDDTMYYI